jgi:hypothetical protein
MDSVSKGSSDICVGRKGHRGFLMVLPIHTTRLLSMSSAEYASHKVGCYSMRRIIAVAGMLHYCGGRGAAAGMLMQLTWRGIVTVGAK